MWGCSVRQLCRECWVQLPVLAYAPLDSRSLHSLKKDLGPLSLHPITVLYSVCTRSPPSRAGTAGGGSAANTIRPPFPASLNFDFSGRTYGSAPLYAFFAILLLRDTVDGIPTDFHPSPPIRSDAVPPCTHFSLCMAVKSRAAPNQGPTWECSQHQTCK